MGAVRRVRQRVAERDGAQAKGRIRVVRQVLYPLAEAIMAKTDA